MDKVTNLVIFDFDGTIVDTMPEYHNEAVDVLSELLDMPIEVASEFYTATAGVSFREQLNSLVTTKEFDRNLVVQTYEDRKQAIRESCEIFQDVLPCFEELRGKGYMLGIVSSNNESFVNYVVARLGLRLNWVSGQGKYKDKPSQIRAAIDFLEPVDSVFYVGDTVVDKKLADMLRIPFIGITRYGDWGLENPIRSLQELSQRMQSEVSSVL